MEAGRWWGAHHSIILPLNKPTILRTERSNTTCPIPLQFSFPGGHGRELRGQRGDQDPAQGSHSAKGKLSNNVKKSSTKLSQLIFGTP
jgi:hypothetical protein